MTQKAVTTAQLEQIRKMAREKGIGRDVFQRGLDEGVFATALDEVRAMAEDLEFVREIHVPERNEPFNPEEDFRACKWLWLSNNMKSLVQSAKPIGSAPAGTLTLSRLKRSMNDNEIMGAAGGEEQHVFHDVSVFLTWVHQILHRQAKGPESEEELLPTDGRWTIFHVDVGDGVFAVYVHWRFAYREWDAYCDPLYGCRWSVGDYAVSSNC